MTMRKQTSLVTKLVVGTWIAIIVFTSTITTVDAMPIARLLSYHPHHLTSPSPHDPSKDTPYQTHSTGRVQIKRLPTPFPTQTPDPHPDLAEWYHSRELQQRQQVQQILQQAQAQAQLRLQLQEQHPVRRPLLDLEGHAILDDEDDDAGNELLDTEFDGLLRPDADDEIEDTIEGQDLVEEDDDEESQDDGVEDLEVDVDGNPGGSSVDSHSREISIFARLALL